MVLNMKYEYPFLLSYILLLTEDWAGCGLLQLIDDFMRKEGISFDNGRPAEILLGRDTRPSGESLVDAARQVILFISCAFFCSSDANSVLS